MPLDPTVEPRPAPLDSGLPDPQPPQERPHTLLRDLVEILALAAVIYLVIAFAVQTVHVEGTSMYPTLHNNDLLLAEKLSLDFAGPSRGSITVIQPPLDSPTDFIKRIVGLPGEWIRIAPNAQGVGHVYISNHRPTGPAGGHVLLEPYVNGRWVTQVLCCTSAGTASPDLPSTGRWAHIPSHDYFVMGDNRNYSEDSRTFGWEPRSGIVAIAIFRFWPLTRVGALPGPVATLAGTTPALLTGSIPTIFRRRRRRRRRRA